MIHPFSYYYIICNQLICLLNYKYKYISQQLIVTLDYFQIIMKFASLLKQHSNSKEHIKPITINCNQNKILLNLVNNNKHQIQNSEDSQNYEQSQNNQPFVTYGKNINMHKLNNQMNFSNSGICLYEAFEQYEQDPSTQWIAQITKTGLVNLKKYKNSRGKLTIGIVSQNKFYPSSKKQNKKNQQFQYTKPNTYFYHENHNRNQQNLSDIQSYQRNLINRSNYSPMKKLRKDVVKVKQYQNKHPIFDNVQIANLNENQKSQSLNLNKFSFGDQSLRKQSQIHFQNESIRQKNINNESIRQKNINQQNGQNLLQKFKRGQQNLIKKMEDNQNLQQSISFILQKNVQFSFEENGLKQNNQKSHQKNQNYYNNHNNEQFILNTVLEEVSVKKQQIKQLDQYALKEQVKMQNKYQIKVVESQFHISSRTNSDKDQQSFRLTDKKQPLQYFIREESKFIIKNTNCPGSNFDNLKKNQHNNQLQSIFINKAIPSLTTPLNQQTKVVIKQERGREEILQKKEERSQSTTKIYCRANIKTLTPQKIKYKRIGGQNDIYQLSSNNLHKQNNNEQKTQGNLFRNQTQKTISLNTNQLNSQSRANGQEQEKNKKPFINFVNKKQNQEEENNDKKVLINNSNSNSNKLEILNNFTPTKPKNIQGQYSKSGNKFIQFLQNKKSSQTQNDRVMRIVLHTPKIQTEKKVQMEKKLDTLINLKDMQQINQNPNSKIQIPVKVNTNVDFDRLETPTPTTNYQQYNGGVSPKSKPKIGQFIIPNLNIYQQTKHINPSIQQTKINSQNKVNNANQLPTINNNNATGQFIVSTHTVNHYASNSNRTATVSPNKTAYTNNNTVNINDNSKLNVNVPINNVTTTNNNNLNHPHYVPYYFSGTQQNQPQSVPIAPILAQNVQTNTTNTKTGYPTSQFTSTYSPKPYVPYYNNANTNTNQNEKLTIGSQSLLNANKPKIFNQLANMQRLNQVSNKNAPVNINQVQNFNSNTSNNISGYKTFTNYQYSSPLAQNSNYTTINNTTLNINDKKNETISVGPLGQYTKGNNQLPKMQSTYNSNQKVIVNHNQQIYHQQPLTNYSANNTTNFQGMNPLTIKQDNKDYLNVNYAHKGTQIVTNVANYNNLHINNYSSKPTSPTVNYLPLTSPRHLNNINIQDNSNILLIQGARHAQSKVYQLKEGSSNSDINFSVQSYN